jgi:hypothetical protein
MKGTKLYLFVFGPPLALQLAISFMNLPILVFFSHLSFEVFAIRGGWLCWGPPQPKPEWKKVLP